jgi:hypothetical protein
MRLRLREVVFFGLLLASFAGEGVSRAQEPANVPVMVGAGEVAGVQAASPGDTGPRAVWAKSSLKGLRWADATLVTFSVEPGTRLEVIAVEGEMLRVREGVRFGWVKASDVQDTAPEPVAPPPGAPVVEALGQ